MRTRSVSVYSLRSEKPVPESAPCFTENVFEVDFFFCNFDGLLKVYSAASFIVLVFVTEAHRYRQLPHTYMDIRVKMYMHMQHTYTRTNIQTLTDTYISSHTHTREHTYTHPHINPHKSADTHTNTSTHMRKHAYTHTDTRMLTLSLILRCTEVVLTKQRRGHTASITPPVIHLWQRVRRVVLSSPSALNLTDYCLISLLECRAVC